MGKHNEASASFLFHLCFSIFSHPIYFSYFIFFSPYILKLISFLSPLFITTTLLLLALLTAVSPNNYLLLFDKNEFSNSKLASLIHWLQSKGTTTDHKDEEIIGCLEEFEAYLVMFQASIFQALEAKSGEIISFSSPSFEVEANESINPEGNKSLEILFQENNEESEKEVKPPPPPTPLESLFFQECEGFEDLAHQKGENEANPKDPDLDKAKSEEGEEEESKVKLGLVSKNEGSRSLDAKGEMKEKNNEGMKRVESKGGKLGLISRNGIKMKVNYNNKSERFLEASLGSPENNWVYNEGSLGSFGSMRKEKEWRRTLACKLFEERHNNNNKNININNISNNNNINNNVNGSEGMDSLWETYDETELDSNKKKVLEKSKTKKGKKSNSNSGVLYYNEEDEEDQNEEDEEEEGMDGKLCCLQALKFSAGKMNLGMGRPNLMKISKAFKGIGWLHHVGKHGSRSKG